MIRRWWDTLSDTELRRRLTQRGVADSEAQRLMLARDHDSDVRDAIDRGLVSDTERTLLALWGPDEAITAGGPETAHMVPKVTDRGVLSMPVLETSGVDRVVWLYESTEAVPAVWLAVDVDDVSVAVHLDLATLRQLAEQALVLCRRHRMAL